MPPADGTSVMSQRMARATKNATYKLFPPELARFIDPQGRDHKTETEKKVWDGIQGVRVQANQQPLLPVGPVSVTDRITNMANSLCAACMAVLYFVTMLCIVGVRNINAAAQPTTLTYSIAAANYTTPNGVDDGGNGASNVAVYGTLTTQMTAYLLVAAFLPPCVWAVVAVANGLEMVGWILYPFRWVAAGDYHAKFLPCLVEAVCLSMIELCLLMGIGSRSLDQLFTNPAINILLAYVANQMAIKLEVLFNAHGRSKQIVKESAVASFKVFKHNGREEDKQELAERLNGALTGVLNPVLTKDDVDLSWFTFVASAAVALKLTPMQIRYNAMPVKPGWIIALMGVVWVWNIFFTSIPYAFYMWFVQLAHRANGGKSDERLLNGGRFLAFLTHSLSMYVFISVAVGITFSYVISTKNPANTFALSY